MSFDEVKDKLFQHHEKLKEISHQNFKGDIHGLEGNIYTYNGENHLPFMVNKMRHIYELAKECNGDILEIGFNAGNSSLIFLMANPTCKIYAFDICIHSYVKPCVDYLNRHFGNRVILIQGNSLETLPKLSERFSTNIKIFHIDGLHSEQGIKNDLQNCKRLAWNNPFVIVDDTHEPCIINEYNKYINEGLIQDCPDKTPLPTLPWTHRIGIFNTVNN